MRGYHIYGAIWISALGERLECVTEPTNSTDRYAVAVIKEGVIIGHIPWKISKICSLFLRRGGTIREYGSTLYVGLARAASPTNTNFRLIFLLTRLQEALYEDLPV